MAAVCSELFNKKLAAFDNSKRVDFKENVAKEILQEIILCGLSRGGFFRKANFNGGTALRLFYGLNRFSEDLDFSVKNEKDSFKLQDYIPDIRKELESYGLNPVIQDKTQPEYALKRLYISCPAQQTYRDVFCDEQAAAAAQHNQTFKIKLEVDTVIPEFTQNKELYHFAPAPFSVSVYDKQTLFACKIGAILGRNRVSNVKGRDFYDYTFYIANGIVPNMKCLGSVLEKNGIIANKNEFDGNKLRTLLCDKFDSIDYTAAKKDVSPFIADTREVELWSADFFKGITINNLQLPDIQQTAGNAAAGYRHRQPEANETFSSCTLVVHEDRQGVYAILTNKDNPAGVLIQDKLFEQIFSAKTPREGQVFTANTVCFSNGKASVLGMFEKSNTTER